MTERRSELEKTPSDLRMEKIHKIEDELLAENMGIMRDVACFRDISPEMTEPPDEWRIALGEREAQKRFRVARAAWLPPKEAPVAIAVAKSVALGILKARSAEKAGNRTLNVAFIQMPTQSVTFNTLELPDAK